MPQKRPTNIQRENDSHVLSFTITLDIVMSSILVEAVSSSSMIGSVSNIWHKANGSSEGIYLVKS